MVTSFSGAIAENTLMVDREPPANDSVPCRASIEPTQKTMFRDSSGIPDNRFPRDKRSLMLKWNYYHQETLDYLKTAVMITKKLCDRVNLVQALIKWLEEESSSKF
ncbi:unnamed protein product [Thlaspi arvense]|uniref:Uncharacterized protein n=1 Tax=Thlaspi arvense TaxID=13288 RepID=A0AAU9TAP2_THLAR|nr:unnamed protein product [Thlaspi arvense]